MVKILAKLYQNSSENRTWDILVKTKQRKAEQTNQPTKQNNNKNIDWYQRELNELNEKHICL